MKKKVLYGVFMALFAFVAVGSLQSCKDDLEDYKLSTDYTIDGLQKDLDFLEGEVDKLNKEVFNSDGTSSIWEAINANKCKCDLTTLRNQLEEKIGEKVSQTEWDNWVETVFAPAAKNASDALTAANAAKTAAGKAQDDADKANLAISKLGETYAKISTVNDLATDLNDAKTAIETLENLVNEDFSQVSNDLADFMQQYEGDMEEVAGQLEDLTARVVAIETQIGDFDYDQYLLDMDAYNTRLESVENQITALKEAMLRYAGLYDRLNSMITGINIESTFNNLFGTFSLPMGVKSNMAVNFYGKYDRSNDVIEFPYLLGEHFYNGKEVLPIADLTAIGAPKDAAIHNGDYLSEGSLGRVYMTINPVNVDFSGATFSMVKSNGEALPIEITPRASDEVLTFGYTRGASANGFYEADVNLPKDQNGLQKAIEATRLEINSNLKTAAKSALKNRDSRSAINLLKAVYDQMSGMLPAYALRADWNYQDGQTDAEGNLLNPEGKAEAVLSKYELAVTTIHPLSYQFYYGHGSLTDRRLPVIGNLKDKLHDILNADDFQFEFDDMHIGNLAITYTPMKFDFDVQYQAGAMKVEIPQVKIYQTDAEGNYVGQDGKPLDDQNSEIGRVMIGKSSDGMTTEVSAEDMQEFTQGVLDAINEAVNGKKDPVTGEYKGGLTGQINDEIKNKVIGDLQNQVNEKLIKEVNDMLDKMETKINDQLADMIDKINKEITNRAGSILDKVDNVINVYNKVAGKINDFLSDPNHFIQPVMLFHGNGLVGIVSNTKMDPTPFKNAGGNAVMLYATSYTAEIVAPAYKKYVACTAVYDKQGNKLSDSVSKAKAVNAQAPTILNTVLPGSAKRVAIPTSTMKQGEVYEITYLALDYDGIGSGQKFYITVNN